MDSGQASRQSSAGTGHYHPGLNQHHVAQQQQQQMKGQDYALETYIPGNSTVAPHQSNGYYQPESPRSNPGSPSKRVAFKGLPNQYNHPGNQGKHIPF